MYKTTPRYCEEDRIELISLKILKVNTVRRRAAQCYHAFSLFKWKLVCIDSGPLFEQCVGIQILIKEI